MNDNEMTDKDAFAILDKVGDQIESTFLTEAPDYRAAVERLRACVHTCPNTNPRPPQRTAEPRVIYETPSYRLVLRPTEGTWREGYIDVEMKTQDALKQVTWLPKCSFSLEPETRQTDEVDVLKAILVKRVTELGIRTGRL